jgi:hypothetical protein
MASRFLRVAVLALGCAAAGCATGSSGTKPLVPNPHFASPVGDYGYSETNPVLVGSLDGKSPVENEHVYLARLRGPRGERVSYRRLGSCCAFPSPNGLFGDSGLLDHYEVTYEGLAHPLTLYIDMYDPGDVHPPAGFTLAP